MSSGIPRHYDNYVTSKSVGPWTLHELLGEGGNAEVFRATDDVGREVALKLITTKNAERERYKRFAQEIAVLRSLDDTTGVLPVVDSYLPGKPTREDRPWLAMPIATTLVDALQNQPLELVVTAVAAFATTLRRLHGIDIGHRDLKPSNLYKLDNEWLVGDFGLVAAPDTRGLTPGGRPLGPAHFMPYEMIVSPDTADPKAADVFSLAKTLYVLATDQRFPPEGHVPAGTRGFEIADYRPHPNARLLDALTDRCTRIHPEERPSMADVASDLSKWLDLPPDTIAVNVGDLRLPLRAKLEAQLAAEDIAAQRKEQWLEAIRRLGALVTPINEALRDLHPRPLIDAEPDEMTRNLVRTRVYGGSPEIVHTYQRLSSITAGERFSELALKFARTVELDEHGALILHLAIWVGYEHLNSLPFRWFPDAWAAPVGSVEAEEDMRLAVAEAATQLKEAVAVFTEKLP